MPLTIEDFAPQRHAGDRAERPSSPVRFEQLVEMADNAGVKLEITAGVPTWEAFPGPRHQKAVGRIFVTVERSSEDGCACFQLLDTYIRFPDGSLKRPDIGSPSD